jgi:PHD/YefM family antitoxin component YafN of YafNO toxin-antitoxin module
MERAQGIKNDPDIIFRDGKPTAVIVDIEQYQEMLELLDDIEDLRELEEMKKEPLEFIRLDDFLKEYSLSV